MRIRIVRRSVSLKINILISFTAFICALAVGGLLLGLLGINPLKAYKAMIIEVLGSFYGISEMLIKAIPLMITGLGLTLAFKMKLWNIGGDGQITMGAFGASFIALYSGIESHIVLISLMFAAAFLCGGIWGGIAGFLKSRLNVNEVITTLLMNYIAISWVNYLVYGPWKDPKGMNFPFTAYFSDSARLTELFDTRLHTGLLLGLALAFIIYIYLNKTIWGYEIKVIGNNPKAADYAGLSSKNKIIAVMFLSGAVAGIAGFSEVAGIQHRLQTGISAGYGYTAVIVAWLARRNPFGVVFVSIIMGILLVGGEGLQLFYSLSANLINAYLGLILFFLVIGDFLANNKLVLIKGGHQ